MSNSTFLTERWPLLVGVDVGGSKIEAIVIDKELQEQGRATGKTHTHTPNQLLTSIVTVVTDALLASGSSIEQVAALGVCVPGRVNRQKGEVANAVNLNLRSPFPLAEELTNRLGRPVSLENDGRSAALGVYHLMNMKTSIRHMAYLNIGTGISAGLVLNGELYRGANGLAGEIGHIIVDPTGERCACGLYGCLETVASGSAIARQAAQLISLPPGDGPPIAATVYELAQQGDEVAFKIVQQASKHFSRALQWIFMAYDVEKVVLGGGVTRVGTAFLDPILVELSRLRAQSSLAAFILQERKISLLSAGYNPGAWGALILAHKLISPTPVET